MCPRGEPRAPATLFLAQVNGGTSRTLLVGYPQAVGLILDHDQIVIGPPGQAPDDAIGLIDWSSDASGAGFFFHNRSTDPVRRASADGDPLPDVFRLNSVDTLFLAPDIKLQVDISNVQRESGGTARHALSVTVITDGHRETITSSHAYVSMGREEQDVIIARPEISARHGHFELDGDGWWYCHDSQSTTVATRKRAGSAEQVHRGARIRLQPGDIIQLSEHAAVQVDFDRIAPAGSHSRNSLPPPVHRR